MRIAMIGTGYVGLVSGACFSEFGLDVVCVDKDSAKIETLCAGKMPIFEPGLDKLVAHNVAAGRLSFTLDLQDAVRDANAVFIAVGTPLSHENGQADLTHLYAAVRDVARFAGDKCRTVVIKSTVPVGTGRKVARLLSAERPGVDFDVVSNPEFLREGAAIGDFMRPDRVIIGAETMCARILMRELYRPLYLIETPIVFTTLETSELTKYAGNAFLATKISFINQMADLCEAVGADVQDVAKGIGLDGRIGRKFLHAGPGYGGSCFPKDTQTLASTARQFGCPVSLVEEVIHYNEQRKKHMVDRVTTALEGTAQGKTVAVLGLTFKPNTDDMRDAPAIDLVCALVSAGAVVRAYDPEGMEEARKVLPPVTYCSSPYEAMQGADVAVIVTEWNEFRGLDMARVRTLLSAPRLVDFRNIYEPDDLRKQGISYHPIGRCAPTVVDSARGLNL